MVLLYIGNAFELISILLWQKENYGTAMETFREGLKYANTNCIDPWDRTGDALEALENGPSVSVNI